MKIILTTTPSDKAAPLVQGLVSERLIACGNIIDGIRSLFHWKGKVCDDQESLILMETDDAVYERLIQRLQELHPYEIPKIITIEPMAVNASFLEWLNSEIHSHPIN